MPPHDEIDAPHLTPELRSEFLALLDDPQSAAVIMVSLGEHKSRPGGVEATMLATPGHISQLRIAALTLLDVALGLEDRCECQACSVALAQIRAAAAALNSKHAPRLDANETRH